MSCSPHTIITDFDNKVLTGKVSAWFCQHNINLRGAPAVRQNQNGLVEKAWQTACNMARSHITDMRMPREYWFWAIHHAVQVPAKNLFDSRVPGDSQLCVERAVEGLPIVRFQTFFFSRIVHDRLNF